jgi:uncharacterized membrane protein YedE/YeeE
MKLSLSTFFAGLIFGIGLTISQMINPAKVLAFLDIAGAWDPSLAFVMGSALLTTFIGYKFVLKKPAPLFETSFQLPSRQNIDASLILGASLFGIGWGLVGLCPGPAIAGIGFNGINGLIFLASMIVTVILYRLLQKS